MNRFSRLRMNSVIRFRCPFSTILNPDSSTPLSSIEKSRDTVALLKSEKGPDRILEICRAAYLNPKLLGDRIAYSIAISKWSESNNFDVIRKFLEESKTRPDLRNERYFRHAMALYGKAGMIQEAINTFKQMEEVGVQRTVKSLNSLLVACILAKDIKELKRIYIDFPKIYSIDPDLETYNNVIQALSESGSSSSAYSVLAEMYKAQIKPDATTFGNMLAGFYKEEKFKEVANVLKLMDGYGVHREVGTYNIIIQSLCKLKKSHEAKKLFGAMRRGSIKPNFVTRKHLVLGFCKEGNLDEAKEMFKAMVNSRRFRPDAECYFTMIYFLCEGGKDFEGALSMCKESMSKGWVPSFPTMKLLVEGLASIDKIAEARELIGKVKEKVSNNVSRWEEVEASLAQ